MKGELLKLITNKNYYVDLASLSDKNIMYDFAKEMYFDLKATGKKSTRDRTFTLSLNSPAIMAFGVSTIFLSENPNELCDKLKLIIQEKRAANISNIIDEKLVDIADKLLEHRCISTKQRKFLLLICLNWMKSLN